MVRHMVAWNYADDFSEEENLKHSRIMKKELENLINLIEGLVSINLYINPLGSSDADLLLDSVFVDEEALKAYITHPEHVRVGTYYVKPVAKNRKCIDMFFEE